MGDLVRKPRKDDRRRWFCPQCGREYRIVEWRSSYCAGCGCSLLKRERGRPRGRYLLVTPEAAEIAGRLATDLGITTKDLLERLIVDADAAAADDADE